MSDTRPDQAARAGDVGDAAIGEISSAELIRRAVQARRNGSTDTGARQELLRRAAERNKHALWRLGE